MKKKLFLFVSLITIGFQVLIAQSTEISGTVNESGTNLPLIGVNIIIKGTTSGTVSDLDGNFTVTVPDQDVILVFSFMGFEQQEISVQGQTSLNISMKETIEAITEAGMRDDMKIQIGGGQIDETVRAYTGADGFGLTAIDAVEFCKQSIAA